MCLMRTWSHYYRERITVSEPSEIDTRVVLRFACLPSHRGLGRDNKFADCQQFVLSIC
ncbi:hypothetical protein CsSME_00053770 [Camellia sinensis var. sinensis]